MTSIFKNLSNIFDEIENWCEGVELVKATFLVNGSTELLIKNSDFKARVINLHKPAEYWHITDFWSNKLEEHFVEADFRELVDVREYWLTEAMGEVKEQLWGLERHMDEIITNLFPK